MKQIYGLEKLRENTHHSIYCPKCGNSLEVVQNGWFGGELFYCHKEKKVFSLYLRDITNKDDGKFIEKCGERHELNEIRGKVTMKNMVAVKDVLEDTS